MSRRPLSLIGSFLFLLAFFAGVFPAGAQTCCTIPQAESAQRSATLIAEWSRCGQRILYGNVEIGESEDTDALSPKHSN